MKKKLLSLALALMMCLGLLPVTALAANDLPDWYFLFAIFKNVDTDCKDRDGKTVHTKYTMTQEEINTYRDNAKAFEEYLTGTGVMRAHVDVVEIDTAITELVDSESGSYLSIESAASLLKGKVDLDKYDHVTCIFALNISTDYVGLGGTSYENGTGQTCINSRNLDYCQEHFVPGSTPWVLQAYCHEFLHFMENMTRKFDTKFGLHDIRINFYTPDTDNGKECYTAIIQNRAKGNAGTGVHPAAWQYPPHVLRTMTELNIPSGVTTIGEWAFASNKILTRVNIPSGVTRIEETAFQSCTNLTSVSLTTSITSVGEYAFANCPSLTDIYYSGSEAQWKAIQIGKYNNALTKANIHYNSPSSSGGITTPVQPEKPTGNATASPTNDKLEVNGAAADPTVYKIGGSNYFKIRDVAALLNSTEKQFTVGYDGALNSVTATTGQGYEKQSGDLAGAATGGNQTANLSNDTIYVDGQKVEAEVYKINGSNYFKLRDLGKALNFYVGWSAGRGMYIETDKPYAE